MVLPTVIIIGQSIAVLPGLLLVAAIWRHAYKVRMLNLAQVDIPYTMIFLRDGKPENNETYTIPRSDIVSYARYYVFRVSYSLLPILHE